MVMKTFHLTYLLISPSPALRIQIEVLRMNLNETFKMYLVFLVCKQYYHVFNNKLLNVLLNLMYLCKTDKLEYVDSFFQTVKRTWIDKLN